MNSHLLLKRFDSIVEAPGNIQTLRKLAIVLAVSGRLGERKRDSTTPASSLLKVGRRSAWATNDPIDESELPSGFTSTEGFVRLGEIAKVEKGSTAIQRSKGGDFPLVTTAEERSSCDHFDFDARAAIVPLVSSAGHGKASLKRLHYQEGKFALGNILCSVIPISEQLITARFIFEYLTAFKEELLVSKMTGTANVTLTVGTIRVIPVPIISQEVQHSLDSFMGLCDRLEAAQRERESRRDRLAASAHHHLNNGGDAEELRSHAQFFIGHLPRLTARPGQIKQLRQTILSLAVTGKLVHQSPEDRPASESLKYISVDRAKLVKAGVLGAQKETKALQPRAFAFNLPNKWEAASLGQIAFSFKYGTSVKCSYDAVGEPVLRIPNIDNGRVNTDDLKFGPLNKREADDLRLRLGDILMVRSNGSLELVGRPAIVEPAVVGYCYAGYLVRVRTSVEHTDTRYLLFALNSPNTRVQIEGPIRSAVGLKNVNTAELSSLIIPLPPLAEQRRIVARVDELMALCDQLEASLTTAQTETSRLLESVLHHALQNPALA